jgi:TonB family protein
VSWGRISKTKTVLAILGCGVAVGFAQGGTDARLQPVRVSGAVLIGQVERKVLPQYPEEALTKGIQGDVIFSIVVDQTGKIVSSEPVKGPALLVAASAEALRNYQFRPYLVNGAPVKVESQLGFHFTLSRKGDSTNGQVECMSTVP